MLKCKLQGSGSRKNVVPFTPPTARGANVGDATILDSLQLNWMLVIYIFMELTKF